MGLIFALGKENTRDPTAAPRENEEEEEDGEVEATWIANFVNGFVDKFVGLPRIVQLFSLYFGLGILAGIGGMIFKTCEYEHENKLLIERNQIWTWIEGNFTAEEIPTVLQWGEVAKQYNDNNKWEIHYAAFFAATTFTTTGFGLQAPLTPLGRIMVFIYGLPAIMIYGVVAKKNWTSCYTFYESSFSKTNL